MKFTSPKVWAPGQIPYSGTDNGMPVGLNDVVAALATALNNIHNEQLGVFYGSKFADASIPPGKLRARTLTAAKLTGTNLMTVGAQSDIAGGAVSLPYGVATEIDALVRTPLGGPVLVIAVLQCTTTIMQPASRPRITASLKRADSPSGDNEVTLRSIEFQSLRKAPAAADNYLWFFPRVDMPGAGTFKWWTEAVLTQSSSDTASMQAHHLWIVEIR